MHQPRISLSPELRILFAPSAAYRHFVTVPAAPSWPRALLRPALFAVLAGATTSVVATNRLTWSLILSGAACWSFVALLQIGIAVALVAASNRSLLQPRVLELFFLGHAAWSLWLLGTAFVLFSVPHAADYLPLILTTAFFPAAWTSIIVFAFCRHALQLGVKAAVLGTALHQLLTWVSAALYAAWAVALMARGLWGPGS